ncbi:hypothetical protein [Thiolinea disciformis]|uniref:hypothetical protein n=1 Tax=Thiolinea disciformis TaxID=125614 RepID=UPI000362AB2B|nr:hypothetical protein [Thiolinea disciformis]
MPYFVFSITQPNPLVKNLELKASFEGYADARHAVRSLRINAQPEDRASYKMVFAANQLEAEERLLEQREKPVLMEWEK